MCVFASVSVLQKFAKKSPNAEESSFCQKTQTRRFADTLAKQKPMWETHWRNRRGQHLSHSRALSLSPTLPSPLFCLYASVRQCVSFINLYIFAEANVGCPVLWL